MVLLDKKINGVDFEKIENHDLASRTRTGITCSTMLSDIFSVNSQAALMPLFVAHL